MFFAQKFFFVQRNFNTITFFLNVYIFSTKGFYLTLVNKN